MVRLDVSRDDNLQRFSQWSWGLRFELYPAPIISSEALRGSAERIRDTIIVSSISFKKYPFIGNCTKSSGLNFARSHLDHRED